MEGIKQFLDKYVGFLKKRITKGDIVLYIQKISDIAIPKKDIEIRGRKIIIKSHPVIRERIFEKKKKIEDEVQKETNKEFTLI